eukprot:2473954-Pyramimonas_sp.AAC.1
MPEWREHSRHRRGPTTPRVALALGARIATRRVESQFSTRVRIRYYSAVCLVPKCREHGALRSPGGLSKTGRGRVGGREHCRCFARRGQRSANGGARERARRCPE